MCQKCHMDGADGRHCEISGNRRHTLQGQMARKIFLEEDIVYQVPKTIEAIGVYWVLMVKRIGNSAKALNREMTFQVIFGG